MSLYKKNIFLVGCQGEATLVIVNFHKPAIFTGNNLGCVLLGPFSGKDPCYARDVFRKV